MLLLAVIGSLFIFGALGIVLWILVKPLDDEMPSLEQSTKDADVVWGLWYTGDRVMGEGLLKYNSIKRILLLEPNPNNQSFIDGASDADNPVARRVHQIEDLTREAIGRGIEVRWYFERQFQSITIYDKYDKDSVMIDSNLNLWSLNAWISVEFFQLLVKREERPRKKITNEHHTESFNRYVSQYQMIWDFASRSPRPEEYAQQ